VKKHLIKARRLTALVLILCLTCGLLPAGAEGTNLVSLQERLLALGYEIGQADGIMGQRTTSAILVAQSLLAGAGFDVEVTGNPDSQTQALILDSANETLLRTLIQGSRGARVKEAQRRLIELSLLRDAADGIFGANTETAVRAFEEQLDAASPGLVTCDGRLTPEEYDLLMSDLGVYGFHSPAYFDESHPEKLKAEDLYAKNAFLINAVTGEALLEKAADEKAEPASTTKIMTLLTALSLADPEKTVVIPQAAADVPADSTLVPVLPGETMTLQDLLYGMIIRSGNDAASAVAVLCAGSVEAFAEEMNQLAAKLGMENSHFVNAHGYTAEGHYTTARDLVIAAREGMTQPLFSRIVTCLQYTLPATEQRAPLILNLKWEIFDPNSEFYIPHAAGIKSGYTSTAGFCYVGAYQDKGVTLIAAVLGESWRNMAWTDLRRLFAYGMAVTEKSAQ